VKLGTNRTLAVIKKEKGHLTLGYSLELGEPGVDDDEINPLSRAVDRLVRVDGQPIKRLALSFFKDEKTSKLRWLGSFVHSDGNRVLFFPGYSSLYPSFHASREPSSPMPIEHMFPIDHVTLDKGFTGIHVTAPRSADQLSCGKPDELEQNRYLWFGMSVSGPEVLRIVKKDTRLAWKTPISDSVRLSKAIREACEGGSTPLLRLNKGAHCKPPGFLHFTVVAGVKGFPDYVGRQLAHPIGSSFIAEDGEMPELLPLQNHRLELSEAIDIQITSAWLPGRLSKAVVFTYIAHTRT
jgi:hypothetical protein